MSVLTVENLTTKYSHEAILNGLNLTIDDNEILCLLGASGCGKTTLLKAIAGLQPISQGRILLHQQDLTDCPVESRQIGLIFQDYALFPHLTVEENICFGLQQKSAVEKKEILQKMTALVHLEGLQKRYPHELSGGQQQRVAIARALACNPRLLLLDEPFSNIDSQVRYQMIEEIKQILKQAKISAIFVTHSKEEAFAFADKLAVMDQGKIVQIGDASSLYQRPNSRFVAEFLGSCNYVECQIHQQQLFSVFGQQAVNPSLTLASGQPVPTQQTLYWLIRPQHIQMQPDDQGNGVIKSGLFLGQFYQYQVEIDRTLLKVQHIQPFNIGTRVRVHYMDKNPVLFLAE
ncbi:ABC transporter ATP-binding protein [[Pasteurella] aerogenes]|nr:ABC transporter ATP-binding protein [[Pasteurella] aerogenes]MDY4480091.1 ABC transporter ATP-binding protein [[Pasteurella] aerogenes]